MPLYEYECQQEGNRFEVIQKFSDPPLVTCPTCGGAVRRLLSSPAIQFKGSGWYITDYARKGSGDGSPEKKPKTDTTDAKPGEAAPKKGSDATSPSSSSSGSSPAGSSTAGSDA
jgi:putative FmdB family regulatory protein